MDSSTFIDSTVVEWLNENVIFVKINGKPDNKKATEFAISHGVKGYPTYILTSAAGEEIDRGIGFYESAEFLTEFENFLAGINTLADYESRAEKTPDADLFFKVAEKYKWRGASTTAEDWYQQSLEAEVGSSDSLRRECFFALADMAYRNKQFDVAHTRFQMLIDKYSEHLYGELGYIYQAICYRNNEQTEKAIARFADYLTAYPKGEEIEYANKQIAKLSEALKEEQEETE
ncbi:hypothetical protein JYT16_00325 [Gemmatimonas aurantiaca]|nr:hypothetical protein [Gemmatimonas aurantiaca]